VVKKIFSQGRANIWHAFVVSLHPKTKILGQFMEQYSDKNIVTLDDITHIRQRPGMYIGGLGDGSLMEDGIYLLTKEVIDNSIDEFRMHFGKQIDIRVEGRSISVRDYGRGIPQGKMIDAVSKLNTGGRYDDSVFQKSVGMNGVGLKAVNAMSRYFTVSSFRDGKVKRADFERGVLVHEYDLSPTNESNGTYVCFTPDCEPMNKYEHLFDPSYSIKMEFVEQMVQNYAYVNRGLTLTLNDKIFISKNGLTDLVNESITSEPLYPVVHLESEDIEIAFTHTNHYGEEYYSFVNGQYTRVGGTHQSAFRESFAKAVKDFYGRSNTELSDTRGGLVAAISIQVQDPLFESQTKIKFNSKNMYPGGLSVAKFVGDFIAKEVDNHLHRNRDTADIILKKIIESEKERKDIAIISKASRQNAKRVIVRNRKLRDCRIHFNDAKREQHDETCIFITEGDSASGSITQIRNPDTQAVFSLRGKPYNSYGQKKEIVYTNEELNCLQAALNIEDGLEGLRYNKVIIATDADYDGMHIRLLLMTFFLQFFPELVKRGHVYILQTPLFRIKNRKEVRYCFTEEERLAALEELKPAPEITRFKGLGEIDPAEFKLFIGEKMRLDQVTLRREDEVDKLLSFYMGDNTPDRQRFILDNLIQDI